MGTCVARNRTIPAMSGASSTTQCSPVFTGVRTSFERVAAGTASRRLSTFSVRSLSGTGTHIPVVSSRVVVLSPISVTRLPAQETPVISVLVTTFTPSDSSAFANGSMTCLNPEPVGSQKAGSGLRMLYSRYRRKSGAEAR